MRGRLLLAHRPGRSLRLPRDRRGERPRTTASPLGAVGTILGPGWGHAIRPITAGRAIGGGDRRVLAGTLTLGAAGIGWVFASPVRAGALAMLLSANTMWSRPRAQRRDESVTATLGSPGVLRQLEQKLHWSAENAHARVGDRYQNRQADSRGSRRTPYNEAAICRDAVSASHCRWPRRRAGRCWSECGEYNRIAASVPFVSC